MSQKLPALVRVHVRDLIDDSDSEVQQALKALNATTGTGFVLEIVWEDIFRDLKSSFPDDVDKLVPSVGRHITLFLQRFETVLDQDEKLQEEFLEQYPSLAARLAIVTQAGPKSSVKIVNKKITLFLPTTGETGFKNAQARVGSDIPSLFAEDEDTQPAVSDEADEDKDWDTVNIVPVKESERSTKQTSRSAAQFQDSGSLKPRPLPKLKSLQRPEVLFEDLLPAYLTVRGGDREVYIDGTHPPTIRLIAEYFTNYTRKDTNDANQGPRFKVEETTSSFGSGAMSDSIHIELSNRNREFRINMPMFLSFVEGVCGYELVDCKVLAYTYKRTVPF